MSVKLNFVTVTARLNILKTIAILIFVAAAATLIHPVFAQALPAGRQDATSSTTRREKVQQRIDTRMQKIDTRIASREAKMMENREERKAKMATREAALKEKLQTFKDKKKAEIAERVNANLNKINQNHTSAMLKHLDKMSALLDKLEARVNQGTDIKDPVAAKAAISSARAAVASASSDVSTQSQKDYTIAVTSETQVRVNAQKMRDALKTDLMSVRKLVIDAKQSVSSAVEIARSGSAMKEGTTSGQQ